MKLLITLIIATFINTPALAKDPPNQIGKVRSVKGMVEIQRTGQPQDKWETLKKGDKVFSWEMIKTGKKGLVVIRLLKEGSIKINRNTKMKLSPPRGATGLELIAGSVFAKVNKIRKAEQGKPKFKLKMKTAVAGVRGTEFFASYGKSGSEGDVWLCVNEGEVEVDKTGQKQLVKAGQGISVTKKGISKPVELPWTKKLNWNMDESSGELENKVSIEEAYSDLLDEDYD